MNMHPDKLAKEKGWMILKSGEAYEKHYAGFDKWEKEKRGGKEVMVLKRQNSSIFIFQEKNGWSLWRATHLAGIPEPISEKTLGFHRDFEKILQRGEAFIQWVNDTKKKSSPAKTALKNNNQLRLYHN